MNITAATELPRSQMVVLSEGKRIYTILHDPDGSTWCAEDAAEQCRHTAAVVSAIAAGTAPAPVPVRRKASGGRRTGAGRLAKRTAKIQNEGVGLS